MERRTTRLGPVGECRLSPDAPTAIKSIAFRGEFGMKLYGSEEPAEEQQARFASGAVPVAVYGLGKMGLPLATVFAESTGDVTGVDVDEAVVRTVGRGDCHVEGEPGLTAVVAEQVDRGALRATTDGAAAAREAAVHVVIVPTLLTDNRRPDLSMLEAAIETIGVGLDHGDIVVVESTVPPGTCRDLVRPRLEEKSDLGVGDFGVACCPERTSSGRALQDIRGAYPKIVGGVDAESTRVAALVYDHVSENEVIPVSDATTAEAVKVFEGLYRDVNIALANELARNRDDLNIDVREAIEAANTQPFCDIHTPGPGVGGHCIPYYPYFLMDKVSGEMALLRTARAVNDSMPDFVVDTLRAELAGRNCQVSADGGSALDGATVLVLGLTYRAGVAETRASPAMAIIDRLNDDGAQVLAADPLVGDRGGFDATAVSVDEAQERDVDGVVLVTAHESFESIDWSGFDDAPIIDTRGTIGDGNGRVYTVGSG